MQAGALVLLAEGKAGPAPGQPGVTHVRRFGSPEEKGLIPEEADAPPSTP